MKPRLCNLDYVTKKIETINICRGYLNSIYQYHSYIEFMAQTKLGKGDRHQSTTSPVGRQVKFYDFDLLTSAEEKWGPIFDAHSQFLPEAIKEIKKLIDSFGFATTVIKSFYEWCDKSDIYYYDEIKYIASRLGFDPFHVLLMQLIYETSTACTATVINYDDNKKLFFRTMDWPLMFLKDLTIGLNVKRGDKLIAKVITWVGYVGFLTASNTVEGYTVTINYRQTVEPTIINMMYNLNRIRQLIWPIGYLVREIMEKRTKEDNAISILQGREIVSPCYITIYSHTSSSCIITRDCHKTVDLRNDNLVQTNCDWGKTNPDILYSVERREKVQQIQKKVLDDKITNEAEIVDLLSQSPIINEETVYLVIMYGNDSTTDSATDSNMTMLAFTV